MRQNSIQSALQLGLSFQKEVELSKLHFAQKWEMIINLS